MNFNETNHAGGDAKIVRLDQQADLSHLPPADTKRWVVSRKAIVVDAVRKGLITLSDVCARYNLSEEEIRSWMKLSERGGSRALRVTRLQDYRRKIKAEGDTTAPNGGHPARV
jgi:hypothetical protein